MFPPGLIHHRTDGPGPGEVPRAGGAPSLVLTADPKPRLRWTADLHERFVDAVAQLGGPESETPPLPLAPISPRSPVRQVWPLEGQCVLAGWGFSFLVGATVRFDPSAACDATCWFGSKDLSHWGCLR